MEITDKFFVGSGELKNSLSPGCSELHMARKCTGKSPDKKAIESIKSWCDSKGDWTPVVVKNTPVVGFKIAQVVSRWSTSNKLFEIIDPRGFKLQISCENLLSLIKDEDISHGTIQTECIWGFDRIPYLMGVHGDTYKKHLSEKTKEEDRVKVTASSLVLGTLYANAKGKDFYLYLGRANVLTETKGRTSSWKKAQLTPYEKQTNNMFCFAKFDTRELNCQDYYNNYNMCLDLKVLKACPKMYGTDEKTIHTSLSLTPIILKRNTYNWNVPIPKYPAGYSSYNSITKFKRLELPEINIDLIY